MHEQGINEQFEREKLVRMETRKIAKNERKIEKNEKKPKNKKNWKPAILQSKRKRMMKLRGKKPEK